MTMIHEGWRAQRSTTADDDDGDDDPLLMMMTVGASGRFAETLV